ncbi:DUF262 domain-containing protein [Methanothrix harundinacea]|uniref:DUF262 domain-containing protein n=1 Tax=Methanothrix harundinacea (strain 6Ac) TaxID=1110509 RepID=G7WKL6_METH6|nr:DUF262 domain-containing protein [Methanothrix harundinacea]AET63495.1 hypothetical protein Mhar_0102 [Methanothrix harundinacea 6Ac]
MSKITIHGESYPISKIFSDEFVFTIPLYQRPYAWTTEHAGELLDDIITFREDNNEDGGSVSPYFLGSIVLIKDYAPDAQVVDGQQRLATLTILLSTLRHLTPTYASDITPFIYEKGSEIKGTPNRYRLTLKEKDAEFFKEYIQDENGLEKLRNLGAGRLSDSQRNIAENALYFLDKLKDYSEKELLSLTQFIINHCIIVGVSTPDFNSAWRIFSILNDRGLDLSITDIIKADVIGTIIPLSEQDSYTDKWEDLEVALGRDTFRDLFAHIRMIHRKTKQKDTILEEFRQYVVKPTKDSKSFIDNVLIPYANAFDVIKNSSYQSYKHAEEVNALLSWLNRIDNVDWIPPAVLYFSKNKDKPNMLFDFFTELERLAASLMILRANINQRLDRYGKLLTFIDAEDDLNKSSSPLQLTPQERSEILNALNGNIYLSKNVPRYVLLRLDAALSDGKASYEYPFITIEHVMPQNPSEGSYWTKHFPDKEDREMFVHKLGNLVLLSRKKNSQARNYDFDKKKRQYFATDKGISPFVLTTQVMQEQEWTPEVIEKRQEHLIEILSELWRL